jgi:hypothetical protein
MTSFSQVMTHSAVPAGRYVQCPNQARAINWRASDPNFPAVDVTAERSLPTGVHSQLRKNRLGRGAIPIAGPTGAGPTEPPLSA